MKFNKEEEAEGRNKRNGGIYRQTEKKKKIFSFPPDQKDYIISVRNLTVYFRSTRMIAKKSIIKKLNPLLSNNKKTQS